jgi:hypothetical protein
MQNFLFFRFLSLGDKSTRDKIDVTGQVSGASVFSYIFCPDLMSDVSARGGIF